PCNVWSEKRSRPHSGSSFSLASTSDCGSADRAPASAHPETEFSACAEIRAQFPDDASFRRKKFSRGHLCDPKAQMSSATPPTAHVQLFAARDTTHHESPCFPMQSDPGLGSGPETQSRNACALRFVALRDRVRRSAARRAWDATASSTS